MKSEKLFLYLLSIISLFSCKKFLDTNPDNRTELNSPEKVSQLLSTAYPQATYASFCEAASDNSNDKGVSKIDLSRLAAYTFTDDPSDHFETPTNYWNKAYAAIAAANQALISCESATNKEQYLPQKGEALIARAYSHFMLVCFFSKVYNSSTANKDMGIPYVTTTETIAFKNYERKTVKYVYEMIEKDLTEGIPLLKDTRYDRPKFHFTKTSAYAFASRFYMFTQDYRASINAANLAFPSNNFIPNMRPLLTAYRPLTAQEALINYTKASDPSNLLLVEAGSIYARTYARERYGVTNSIMDKVMGENVTGNSNWIFARYGYGPDNPVILKWYEFFLRTSVNSSIGSPFVIIPLFSTEEVLLNRAEAYARLGKYDSSLADLNTYASQRFENYNLDFNIITSEKAMNYYEGNTEMQALINSCLDFKRAEFIFEGLRWFDNIRTKITISHNLIDVNESSNITHFDIPPDDLRRVFQIPVLAKQAGIEANPR